MKNYAMTANLHAQAFNATEKALEGDVIKVGAMKHPILGEFRIAFAVNEPARLVVIHSSGKSAVLNVVPALEQLCSVVLKNG